MITIFFAGFLGGAVRGFVGFLKYKNFAIGPSFRLSRFLLMACISGLAGVGASYAGFSLGSALFSNPAVSFVLGYAGGDFLESAYRILRDKFSSVLLKKAKQA
ncbi:MAG: hypothetical protein HYV78_01655 [Candidatus Wildermuthbacteria bacterium]|nr:hypothetical protein [Candidatus Wildermuthbacteria bacterium]